MPKAKRPKPIIKSDREPALVAELRDAIRDCEATLYRLAQKAGVDEASVRRFVTRERSLSLDSGARLVEALGLRIVRPPRPRRFSGAARPTRGGEAPAAAGRGAGPGSPAGTADEGP